MIRIVDEELLAGAAAYFENARARGHRRRPVTRRRFARETKLFEVVRVGGLAAPRCHTCQPDIITG